MFWYCWILAINFQIKWINWLTANSSCYLYLYFIGSLLQKLNQEISSHLGNNLDDDKENRDAPMPLIPGSPGLEITPGEILRIQTTSNGRGRDMYRQLVVHFHGEGNIINGVAVPHTIHEKCASKQTMLVLVMSNLDIIFTLWTWASASQCLIQIGLI